MLDLRHLCKMYDRRTSLALIPFYQYRLEYLQEEKERAQDQAYGNGIDA